MKFFRGHKEHEDIDVAKKTEELRSAISENCNKLLSDDDCHRFLRARDYQAPKSADMISKWGIWWNSPLPNATDKTPSNILDDPMDPKEHIYQKMLPHANLGEDKEGRPVYWEKTGLISSRFAEIKKHLSEDDLFVRHIRQQELMVDRLREASTKQGRLIEKQIIIFDLADLVYNLDFMAMNVFRRTLVADEMFYPERLQTLYMINAPGFFTTIWAMMRRWVNPVTAQKIRIIGKDYQAALKEVIAEDQIPVEYGGTWKDFPWTYPENQEMDLTQRLNIVKKSSSLTADTTATSDEVASSNPETA